jgi:NAD(P)-dependent dehydrogenase (short-subunit alcohol dehydrogenase family)
MAPSAIIHDLALPASIPESQQTPANASHGTLFSLSKKTIAITGGGRGLGITLAAAVLEAGGNVACLDILDAPSPTEWAGLQKTAKLSGLHASYHKCDITNEEQLAQTMDSIADEGLRLDAPFYGAIACAGIQQKLPAVEYPAADFERILKVNVTGTFLTAKHSARILIASGVKGSIVLIASMSGQVANRVSYVLYFPLPHYSI